MSHHILFLEVLSLHCWPTWLCQEKEISLASHLALGNLRSLTSSGFVESSNAKRLKKHKLRIVDFIS